MFALSEFIIRFEKGEKKFYTTGRKFSSIKITILEFLEVILHVCANYKIYFFLDNEKFEKQTK